MGKSPCNEDTHECVTGSVHHLRTCFPPTTASACKQQTPRTTLTTPVCSVVAVNISHLASWGENPGL